MAEEQKNIEFIGGGIVCDNPACDYEDNTVLVEDYKNWINKPCPKCGENLLTEQDLIDHNFFIQVNNLLNELLTNLLNELSPEQIQELISMINPEEFKSLLSMYNINPESETLQMTAKIHNGIHIENIKEFKNGEEQ